MKTTGTKASGLIWLKQGGGRRYEMGQLAAIFMADEEETDARYSVSEWLLKPGLKSVGAHSHEDNDEVFFVIEGKADVRTGDAWRTAETGTFIRIPAGTTHDLRNLGNTPARLLNLFIPGGFERNLPLIVEWFVDKERSSGEGKASR